MLYQVKAALDDVGRAGAPKGKILHIFPFLFPWKSNP